MTTEEMVNLGVRHLYAGQLDQAQSLCRRILQQQPDQPDALHLLGAIAHKRGDHKTAIELTEKAIAISPRRADFYVNLGLSLLAAGRNREAVAANRRAVELAPDLPQAHNNLGLALAADGKTEEAIECHRRAASIAPDFADASYNLGNAYMELGNLDQAIVEFRAAIALRPDWAIAHNNLGVTHRRLGEHALAVECYGRALAAAPEFAMAWANLGGAHLEQRDYEPAIAACRRALQLDPILPDAHNTLGLALCSLGQYPAAIASLKTALAMRPQSALAHNNLGNAYHWSGAWNQALDLYHRAIALKPDYAMPRWNVGLIHLIHADYEQGWPEYEWRSGILELQLLHPDARKPRWDGAGLHGRRILVYAEQGLGDTLQFVRYLPRIAQRGGKIVLSCQRELVELMRIQSNDIECVESTDPNPPRADVQIALPSLPGIFATRLETVPRDVPYLKADAEKARRWETRLDGGGGNSDGRRKIGLAWAGSRRHPHDPQRSMRLEQFAPLARIGARLISLQIGDAGAQLDSSAMEIENWTEELDDFSDTAALIQNLDLIITVDTAVAHLAGAMGKPVWVLINFVPDWRWLLDRTDSPWYPTMHLFRQEKAGDWTTPINRIIAALNSQ